MLAPSVGWVSACWNGQWWTLLPGPLADWFADSPCVPVCRPQLVHMNSNGIWVGRGTRSTIGVEEDGFALSETASDHWMRGYKYMLRVRGPRRVLAHTTRPLRGACIPPGLTEQSSAAKHWLTRSHACLAHRRSFDKHCTCPMRQLCHSHTRGRCTSTAVSRFARWPSWTSCSGWPARARLWSTGPAPPRRPPPPWRTSRVASGPCGCW